MTKLEIKKSVYQEVTDRIIKDLETGICPWTQSWNSTDKSTKISRPLRRNGEYYKGINILLLWISSLEHNFISNRWLTFAMVKELGGKVKKDSKATNIIFPVNFEKEVLNKNNELVKKDIYFKKFYQVFNLDQTEGLENTEFSVKMN